MGNNCESVNASVTRPDNEIMSELIKYHQSLTTLKRQYKSESNDAQIKLVQEFVDSLAVEMEENSRMFRERLRDA